MFLELPPLATGSIVGFAEAVVIEEDMAADLARRVMHNPDAPVPEPVLHDVGPPVLSTIESANSQYFRFVLTDLEFEPGRMLVATEATTALPGLGAEAPTRKLTAALTLRGGGAVRFPSIDKERRLRPGQVAIFPAFLTNEVLPDDELVMLVCHATGPSFV